MRDPRSLSTYSALSREMKKGKIDTALILAGSGELWLGVLASMLHDIPVCSTMIVPKPNLGDHPKASVVVGINKLLAWGSDVIIVNGQRQVSFVQQKYHIPADRVYYVPLMHGETLVRCIGGKVAEDPAMILFFGRVEPHKGIEYLIRAQPLITSYIAQATIVIAGHGSGFAQCRRDVAGRSSIELYEGFVSNRLAAELFQRAAVVVLPYLSASTSGVLATAQLFGKPVVATNVGCLPEYIEDGVTGLLVPPADEKKLAEAIVRLLTDERLRHRMGESAALRANKERMNCVDRTLAALEMTINVHRKKNLPS
jgi:glycosyltransferase involved in cell wall biosynthesis